MKKIPQSAIDEINGILAKNQCISAKTGAAILKKHGVTLDAGALEERYLRTLFSRHMATYRDAKGRRNYLAFYDGHEDFDYKHVDLVESIKALEGVSHGYQSRISGLGTTNEKVQHRIAVLHVLDTYFENELRI